MLSTAIKRVVIAFVLCVANFQTHAQERPPSILQEPIFGLRFKLAEAKLDPLPDDIRSTCNELADNENWRGHLWIYATASDMGGTYYVVGGYYERPHPDGTKSRYYIDTSGAAFKIAGTKCTAYGGGREVFDARYFEEIPQPVFVELAKDLVTRLTRALGGPGRLRTELRKRGVNAEQLPQELKDEFKTYLALQR